MGDGKYNCTVCKVSLSSWAELQQHLQGSSHKLHTEATIEGEDVRAAMANGFLVLHSSQQIKCLLCKIVIEFYDSKPIYNHIQEMEHKRLASIGLPEEEPKAEPEVKKTVFLNKKGKSYSRESYGFDSQYDCTICGVHAKDDEQLKQHLGGGKHKLRAMETPEAEEVKAQLDKGVLRQKSGLKIYCLLCKVHVDFIDDIQPIYLHINDSWHMKLNELGLEGLPTEAPMTEEEFDAKLNADESPEAGTVREAIKAKLLKRKEGGKFVCKCCRLTLDFKEVRPLNEHLTGNKHQYNAYWFQCSRARSKGRPFPPPPMWGTQGTAAVPQPSFHNDYYGNSGFDADSNTQISTDGDQANNTDANSSEGQQVQQQQGQQQQQTPQNYYGPPPPGYWGPYGPPPPFPPWMMPPPFWGGRGGGRFFRRGGGGRGRGRFRGGRRNRRYNNKKNTTEDDETATADTGNDEMEIGGEGEQQSYGLENLEENIVAALDGSNFIPPKKRVRNIEVISGK
ncbi:unnamed protein product [Meganyctiphanes norvegica]|uniref:C2H2-type domain-containing protein n=1 Tax=Meganyctiphanes norvegica TaxID=48144 RepID=A0AAV2PXE2_MEGNR